MQKNIKSNSPIILGLAGKAGSGKTSVAEQIVPKGSFSTSSYGIIWDHIFYALPLYEFSSIRRTISGANKDSRQLYAIHSVLYDIYGSSAIGSIPNYEDFIDRVKQIKNLPIEPDEYKPRSFLQNAGDICRNGFEDCFAKWGITKSNKIYNNYIRSADEDTAEFAAAFAVIISDVRFENEAKAILEQPNGMVVCFDADQSVLDQRILARDGRLMTEEHMNHKSEQEISIVKEMATAVIDTTNMNIEQQTRATLEAIGALEVQSA
jgi:cytidylate kinase